MAHKKGVGSTDNGRDSKSKRLGVKLYGGQLAKAGNIIVRQRGTKFHAGENVYKGKDFTLHAQIEGTVQFRRRQGNRTYVNILPLDQAITGTTPDQPKPEPQKQEPKPTQKAATATAVVEEAPKSSGDKIELPSGKKVKQDDLKLVEGIGPKIEGLLQEAGINSWKELAEAPNEKVQEVLDNAGPRYRMHDPATWSKQAQLAMEGKWAELEQYQEELKGGKE